MTEDAESGKQLLVYPQGKMSNSQETTTAETVRTSTAREGREHQAYADIQGRIRLVAGGVVLDSKRERVLMVSSSKHRDRWILPKGGVETDEMADFAKAALRETWEEAGAVCQVTRPLPVVGDHRKAASEGIALCEFHMYELQIVQLEEEWPERAMRERRWATFAEARAELQRSKRPELVQALEASSISK